MIRNASAMPEPGFIAQPARIGMISAANSAPIPWVVQRPQPTFGPMNPTATPSSAQSDEAVRERAAPVDPGRVVDGPGQDQPEGGNEREDDPALLGAADGELAAVHHAKASARGLCGSRTTVAIWYSASA